MEVVKMRGQATLPGLHTFRIDDSGIKVFAPPTVLPDQPQVPPGPRLSMGVPGLDEMMGGGLPRGYSLLVAGPSGSGKSILAASFLAEGARRGETSVIAAFEQHPHKARGRVVAQLIDEGKIGVVDTRTSPLSVDEIAMVLIAEINRLKASRVVIDSLSGFELALAPTFREDFRESLARMMLALASTNVTVLMTSELEDRYYELGFSPYGTAFLTDSIIMQRYIEVESRLERVLAVVKMRASAHSNQLHLFHIDDDGIKIGARLSGHDGLLTGSPARHDKPGRLKRSLQDE
jgi:circadian clock protein KaiC